MAARARCSRSSLALSGSSAVAACAGLPGSALAAESVRPVAHVSAQLASCSGLLLPGAALLVLSLALFAYRSWSLRRAEAKLRATEDRFDRLIDFAPAGIFMHDGERIVYANSLCAEILGATTPADIVGRHSLSFVHPGFQARVSARVAEHLRSGQSMNLDEQVFVRLDGREINVEVAATPLEIDGRRLVQVVFLDTSARKQAEAERLKAEERYRTIFERAIEGIYRSTAEGRFEVVNPPLAAMLGYDSPADLMDSVRDLDLDFYADPGRRKDFFACFERGDEARDFESRVRRKDGRVIWILENTRAVRNAQGEITHFEGSMLDITRRKEVEQRLKASLEEKEVMLREIHHRVKNNLQVVSAFLSLQGDLLEDTQARNAFREGQNRIRALAAIHESLYQSPDLRGIDLATYIPKLARYVVGTYQSASCRPRLELDVAPTRVDIDTAIPCGLMVNELVSNALKHGYPDGRSGTIRVGLARENGHLKLSVRDDGVGLPPTFDPQGRETLGMQILGALVHQLGGSLEYASSLGTEFMVTFAAKIPQTQS